MGNLVLGVFRSAATAPATPVDIGARLMWIGDSQTAGYGEGTCDNHSTAMRRIMQTKGIGPSNAYTSPPTGYIYTSGVGGSYLADHRTVYDSRADQKLVVTYLHVQESGSQNTPSQDTAAEYKALWKAFAIEAQTNSPGVVLMAETSFSFGPVRQSQAFRNWDPYDVVLREAKTELLAENGITLYIAEVNRDIKLLEIQLTPADVWFQGGDPSGHEYHYKSVGHLMIALSAFRALNITVTLADLADVTEVSTEWKQICLNIRDAN